MQGRVARPKGGQRDVNRREWAHKMLAQGNGLKDAGHGVDIETKDMKHTGSGTNMGIRVAGHRYGHRCMGVAAGQAWGIRRGAYA